MTACTGNWVERIYSAPEDGDHDAPTVMRCSGCGEHLVILKGGGEYVPPDPEEPWPNIVTVLRQAFAQRAARREAI